MKQENETLVIQKEQEHCFNSRLNDANLKK